MSSEKNDNTPIDYIINNINVIKQNLSNISPDNPTILHNARKASRRLKVALKEIKPFISKSFYTAIMPITKSINKHLGYSRELDIMKKILIQCPQNNETIQLLINSINKERTKEEKNINNFILEIQSDLNYEVWIKELNNIEYSTEKWLERALNTYHRKYDILFILNRIYHKAPSDLLLHQIRIQYKNIRYYLELNSLFRNDKTAEMLIIVEKSQEILGLWNDYRTLNNYVMNLCLDKKIINNLHNDIIEKINIRISDYNNMYIEYYKTNYPKIKLLKNKYIFTNKFF